MWRQPQRQLAVDYRSAAGRKALAEERGAEEHDVRGAQAVDRPDPGHGDRPADAVQAVRLSAGIRHHFRRGAGGLRLLGLLRHGRDLW